MSETKLLPCPFCGGKATLRKYPAGFRVECNTRECFLWGTFPVYKMGEKAAEAWNTRKPMKKTLEELEFQKTECEKYWDEFGDEDMKGGMGAYENAIAIVKRVGGVDE